MKVRWEIKGMAVLTGLVLLAGVVSYYWQFLTGQTFLWEDLLYYSYPSANFFGQALHAGRFPLWISGMHNGLPFYTNLNLTAFYPPLWLLALVVPGGKVSVTAYQCYLVFQLLGAGAFAYLFLRDLRLHVGAAMLGMTVFVFSAFMSLHIIHVNVITSFLWLPLQCLFVNRLAGRRFAPGPYLGLVLATLMSFLAGFPQVLMYNSYCVGVYWLFLFLVRRERDSSGSRVPLVRGIVWEGSKIAAVFLVVILAGAAQFYPVAENWSLSAREQYSYRQITDESMPLHYLLHGLVPNFFGVSTGSGGEVPFWGFDKTSLGYETFHGGAWQYWEFGFFAGQLALISIFVFAFNYRRLWASRREFVFFLWALPPVLVLMMGCHGGLFKLFYHVVPGFSLFRAPARIGCLLDFCLAVNAALLVDVLLENKLTLNLRRPFVALGLTYGLLAAGVLVFGSSLFPELKNPTLWGYSARQIMQSILFCALVMGLLWFVSRSRGVMGRLGGVAALVVLTFLELALAFQPFHKCPVNPDDYYTDRNGLIGQMAKLREANGPFRFAQLRDGRQAEELVFPRNIGYLFPNYEALEGYVLFNQKDWSAFCGITNQQIRLDIANVGVIANVDSRTRQVGLLRYTNSLPRVKFYTDVRAYDDVKAMYADLDSGGLNYQHTVGLLREDCLRYGIATSSPPARVDAQVKFIPVNPDEYRISYKTTAPGIIFISESFYPGWQADSGNYEVVRTFGAFKGIVIRAAGSGVITMKFSPKVLHIGLLISGTTISLLMVMLVVMLKRSKREEN